MSSITTVQGRSVLVTGADRGIGRALVHQLVRDLERESGVPAVAGS